MSRRLLNIAFIFSLLLILNTPITYGQCLYDYPDVHVFPSGNPQSEVHISVNPTNPNNLVLSYNTYINGYSSQGYFYSTDGGGTWNGSENLYGDTTLYGGPSTAFDAENRTYIPILNQSGTHAGIFMQSFNSSGNDWTNISVLSDFPGSGKNMITADHTASRPYVNNIV